MPVLDVILQRMFQDEYGTFGALFINGDEICVTCEDPWNDNENNISCIPAGKYLCVPHSGTKYKNVWRLVDVPDRKAILIHNGNNTDHTEGCILVGQDYVWEGDNIVGINNSRATMNMLRSELPSTFYIEVRDVE